MIHLSDDDRRRAFATWLRTGRLPVASAEDGRELKFNPWHDPADGRLTFAGSGRRFGAGEHASGASKRRRPAKLPTEVKPSSTVPRSERLAAETGSSAFREAATKPRQRGRTAAVPRPTERHHPAIEFALGAAEGLGGSIIGAGEGVHAALTTNPFTTVRNAGRAIAGTIDSTIAAEDVPARIQISRAADAVAHASAHDLGRAAGSVAGNVALVVAPEAALSKVSALRRVGAAGSGEVIHEPLQVHWVKENLGRDSPAKRYNDMTPGARPGHAPALPRKVADGSTRPVKFDGIQGEYLIDAKHSIRDQSHAWAQLLRQSDVLAQHRLIGIWEVPNQAQKVKAKRMLKRINVNNIKVRIRVIEK